MTPDRVPLSYRIALRAWPRDARNSAGADMLSTLLDADADRGGSSVREAVDLFTGGVRVRLRDRRSQAACGLSLLLVLTFVMFSVSRPEPEQPAVALSDFSVLQDARPEDRDAQVLQTVREIEEPEDGFIGVQADKARLLGKAPSGSAYVLVPVREYREIKLTSGDFVTTWHRNGLFLVRRGTQGGAGDVVSRAQAQRGALFGAMAGEVYGLVPDGVVAVRPADGGPRAKVRRNFFAYPTPGKAWPSGPPTWYDAHGKVIPKR